MGLEAKPIGGAGGEIKPNNQTNDTNKGTGGVTSGMIWMGYISMIVLALVIGALIIFGYLARDKGNQLPPAIMVPAVGIITLLGVLSISNFFQGNSDMRNGQIRAAIAASVLAVYFFVLSLVLFTGASDKLNYIPPKESAPAATNNDAQPAEGEGNASASASSATTRQKSGMADVMDSFTDLVKVVILGYFAVRGVNEVTNSVTDTIKQVNANQSDAGATPPAGTGAQVTPPAGGGSTTPPTADPNAVPLQKPDRDQLANPPQ